ncbi:hypothetical protein [Natribacillus halophilus]|uniref:40-residue YVTN family beta-propeller repeat-containing protein n=1 Tax=Natribacillus halophilus TaxID=549003 RepID=A0A1G8LML1_9BACI|nr:hypothetical protein [Natribacillus halophilus]SDI56855.1 hypothetical protein SAMN04488123_103173 [Natribacillus halophilus]
MTNNTLFYFTANEGGISKIDVSTNKVFDSIKINGTVHNVQMSPDNKMMGITIVPSGGHGGHEAHDGHDAKNEKAALL